MARPHKQMPGNTYHIDYHGDGSATIECTYLCPYCNQDTASNFEVNPDVTALVEQGGFFEPLHCDHCGKVTDVRFWQSNKI